MPGMLEDENMAHAAAKHRDSPESGHCSPRHEMRAREPVLEPQAVGIARLPSPLMMFLTPVPREAIASKPCASMIKCFTCGLSAGGMRCKGSCPEEPVGHEHEQMRDELAGRWGRVGVCTCGSPASAAWMSSSMSRPDTIR